MNSIANIGLSGMNAAMRQLGASAHNIANAQTPGFRRQQVLQQTLADGGVRVSVAQAAEPGEHLAEDMVQQMSASYAFKANLRVVQTQDQVLGSLLDVRA
ncbi:flagellar basal body rod C-terminal domain-containing protein [Ideonella sp. BN130291]|uniref:flagellar basal body rod C-terminal domain-containing protein n=1 Tax=Ideonella sp. BN130291 TaxID=3112940 RepID=UPI002E270495|nr:flagellar basal body protein [Ideonella sp. BN130291]